MDDMELDDWFNEEREKLETVLLEALQNNKQSDNADNARKIFDKKYKKLIVSFQKQQEQSYTKKRRLEQMQKPIDKMRAKYENISSAVSAWWTKRKEAVRRWFFERKIKRILRDKSDR